MDKINPGIYWIRCLNVCPCQYCREQNAPAYIELAKYTESGWEVFGSDEGINSFTEVEILKDVEPYNGNK